MLEFGFKVVQTIVDPEPKRTEIANLQPFSRGFAELRRMDVCRVVANFKMGFVIHIGNSILENDWLIL